MLVEGAHPTFVARHLNVGQAFVTDINKRVMYIMARAAIVHQAGIVFGRRPDNLTTLIEADET
eukprot:12879884-Alexandrium_andersonii.AAC.1